MISEIAWTIAIAVIGILAYHSFMLQRSVQRLVKRSALSEERALLSRERIQQRWDEQDRRSEATQQILQEQRQHLTKAQDETDSYRADMVRRAEEGAERSEELLRLQREQVELLRQLVDQQK